MKKNILSNSEWKIMNLLWENSSMSISELVLAVKDDTDWTKGTICKMLKRMQEKGAVDCCEQGKYKKYFPVIDKEDAAVSETKSFLSKIYGGSIGLMISSMVEQNALSKQDIAELYAILKEAEKNND